MDGYVRGYYGGDLDTHNLRYNHHYLPQSSSSHEEDYLLSSQPRYGGHDYDRHGPPVHNGYHYDPQWQGTHMYSNGYEDMSGEDDNLSNYPSTPASTGNHVTSRSRHNSIESSTTNSSSSSSSSASRHANRHSNAAVTKPRPVNDPITTNTNTNTSSSSSTSKPHCTHTSCLDPTTGLPQRFFSRRADVARHVRSMHEPSFIDCPRHKCNRRGGHGFTRQDHLTEHLRQYHQMVIPRRGVGRG